MCFSLRENHYRDKETSASKCNWLFCVRSYTCDTWSSLLLFSFLIKICYSSILIFLYLDCYIHWSPFYSLHTYMFIYNEPLYLKWCHPHSDLISTHSPFEQATTAKTIKVTITILFTSKSQCKLFQIFCCISKLFHCCDKIPEKWNSRNISFWLTVRGEKSHGGRWLLYICSPETENNECSCSVHLPLFIWWGIPTQRIVLPTVKVYLSTLINLM